MDREIDLTSADRDTLIAIIVRQQAIIERLEQRIAQLEGLAKSGGWQRNARSEAQSRAEASPAPETPLASAPRFCPRPHDAYPLGGAYRVEHVVEQCPDCGVPLSGGWTQRTREVIELPQVPAEVTEHVYIVRDCTACRRRCVPQAQMDGVVLGQQRLGINLVSLIATLREEARLPIGAIQ